MSPLIRSMLALALLAEGAFAQAPTLFCFPNTAGVLNCPCNNPPIPGGAQGCNNFSGHTGGAVLHVFGNSSISNDTLYCIAYNENPNVYSNLLESTTANSGGLVYGAGIRCVTVPLRRVYGRLGYRQTTSLEIVSWGYGFGDPPLSVDIGATAGLTTYFQAWYRDQQAASHCSDPSATFNITNAAAVVWTP
jgi:hypothetical protein